MAFVIRSAPAIYSALICRCHSIRLRLFIKFFLGRSARGSGCLLSPIKGNAKMLRQRATLKCHQARRGRGKGGAGQARGASVSVASWLQS